MFLSKILSYDDEQRSKLVNIKTKDKLYKNSPMYLITLSINRIEKKRKEKTNS